MVGGAFFTEFGESFVGKGTDAAHVNTVIGKKGGPVETAWVTSLATPRLGHVPFVAVLRPGLPVQPMTLFVNKAALAGERHEQLTWGPAQAGVAAGVADALVEETVDPALAPELLLIAAVWVAPGANDDVAVFENNRAATTGALRAGHAGSPTVDDVLAGRNEAWNPFFRSS